MSMGEGQEEYAVKAMNEGAKNGSWVLLQNCELGLDLMVKMEDFLANLYASEGFDANFRLFITALPEKTFPLGLLQMSTKVTNEPPAGLKAGVLKSYTVLVDQDRLERVDTVQWRQLLFALCFMHSLCKSVASSVRSAGVSRMNTTTVILRHASCSWRSTYTMAA